MTNEKALILAFMMAGLAAASYHYGYRGIAIVALFAVAAFAIWPIRLKWGFAGREQWQEIRLRGRTYFVLTRGVWFAGVLVSWTLATQYVADSHLPNHWFRELLCYLGWVAFMASSFGDHGNGNIRSKKGFFLMQGDWRIGFAPNCSITVGKRNPLSNLFTTIQFSFGRCGMPSYNISTFPT